MSGKDGDPGRDFPILARLLAGVPIGSVVTHKMAADACGRPWAVIESAFHRAVAVAREDGIAFGNIRGEGWKRLNDMEIVTASDKHVRGLGKKAKVTIQHLGCVQNFEQLPSHQKLRHCAVASVAAAVSVMTRPKEIEKVERAARDKMERLALEETLRVFA